jgi:DNA-binding CsgD family transcriptional regulator
MYALALRHAEAAPAQRKVVLLEQHAFESYLSGLAQAAAQSWRLAAALRHDLDDPLGESENLRYLSHVLWPLGRTTEAVEAGLASLRLLEGGERSTQLAWSLVNLAEIAAFGYDPAAVHYAARAIELGSELGDPAVVIRARCYAAVSRVLRTDSGWEELEGAWREAMITEELAQHAGLMGAMTCWAAALHLELDRASAHIAETTAFCGEHDFGMFGALALAAGARVALYRGDWSQAVACAEDVLTRPGLSPLHRILPLVTVALIRARRGQQPVAPLLDEALAAAEPNDLFRLGAVWAARAEAAWLAGDDDTAKAEAHQGICATNATADPWLGAHLHRWEHLPASPPTLSLVDDQVTPYRLEITGDWSAATTEWLRRGCPYDAALAQLGGDVAAVESALVTLQRLGAHAAARRARHRLAQLRGRAPYGQNADTRADPSGLTRRQREVLELLAVGHSDAHIAAELCISPKTVAKHVSAILVKLGVRNRTQAAGYAANRQSTPG